MKFNAFQVQKSNLIIVFLVINLLPFFYYPFFIIYQKIILIVLTLEILLLMYIFRYIANCDKKSLIIFCLLMLYVTITFFLNDSGIGSIITLLSALLLTILISNIKISLSENKIIFTIFTIFFFYLLIISPNHYQKYLQNIGYTFNSNTIGMLILLTSIYCSIYAKLIFKKSSNIYSWIFLLLGIKGIINCNSRGSLVGIFLFVIIDKLVAKKLWMKNKFLIKLLNSLLISAGFLFPCLYIWMYKNNIYISFENIDKQFFTGREVIWINFFNEIGLDLKKWLIGIGSKANFYEGHALNMHNIFLAILVNFGIIGSLFFWWFFTSQIKTVLNKKTITEIEISFIFSFFAVLLVGYLEVTMLYPALFILSYWGFCMAIRLSRNQ